MLPRDRRIHPYNVEITETSAKDFEAIAANWPLIVDSLDALFDHLQTQPRASGLPVRDMEGGEFFVDQTPATTGRPSLRILYEIEEEHGRVTIHHLGLVA